MPAHQLGGSIRSIWGGVAQVLQGKQLAIQMHALTRQVLPFLNMFPPCLEKKMTNLRQRISILNTWRFTGVLRSFVKRMPGDRA